MLGIRGVADGATSTLVDPTNASAEAVPVSARTRVSLKASHTLWHLALAYGLWLALPIALYAAVGGPHPTVLVLVHYVVASACAVTAAVMTVEAACAWRRKAAPQGEYRPVDRTVTFIVCAYLPNEQHLIMETVRGLRTSLATVCPGSQIILAYNTPHALPVEHALRDHARRDPHFVPLRVHGSNSKAENIHAALGLSTGEMTVLLDADHHLLTDAVERAWRWLDRGYDVVQGRCVIRGEKQSVLTRWVGVEFEQVYAVLHAGRSMGFDIALFGGSNGYWRTSVLREITMDPSMLTEDIDATVRATMRGYRFVHDRSIVASELAPGSFASWWAQRLRWAQGWLQVTMRHQRAILASQGLSWKQKAYWTYLLSWRELFPVLSLQGFALLATAAVLHRPIGWFSNGYFVATAILTAVAGPLATVVAYRRALWQTRSGLGPWFVAYAVLSLPYTLLKNSVSMAAQVRQAIGRSGEWVVTSRAPGGAASRDPAADTDPWEGSQTLGMPAIGAGNQ